MTVIWLYHASEYRVSRSTTFRPHSYQACAPQDSTQSHRRCSGLAYLRLMSALEQGGCEPSTGSSGARVRSNECIFPSTYPKRRGNLVWGLGGLLLLLPLPSMFLDLLLLLCFPLPARPPREAPLENKAWPTFFPFDAGRRKYLCLAISQSLLWGRPHGEKQLFLPFHCRR